MRTWIVELYDKENFTTCNVLLEASTEYHAIRQARRKNNHRFLDSRRFRLVRVYVVETT